MTGLRISVVFLAGLAAAQYWLGLGLGLMPGWPGLSRSLGVLLLLAPLFVALPGRWSGPGILALTTIPLIGLALALLDITPAQMARLGLWPLALAALSAGLALASHAIETGRDPVPFASLPLGAIVVFVLLGIVAQPGLATAMPGGYALFTATQVHLALTFTTGAILAGLGIIVLRARLTPSAHDFLRAMTGLLPLLGFVGTVLGIMSALAALPDVLGATEGPVDDDALRVFLRGLATAFETTLLGLIAAVAASLLIGLTRAGLPWAEA